MRTIYMLNVKGDVIYGECDFYEYPRIKQSVENADISMSIIEECISDELFPQYQYACR